MTRWLNRLLAASTLLLPTLAAAAAYSLPGNLPPGCTASGSNYSCPALSLGYNDTLTVAAPKPATLTINGNFSTGNAQINVAGTAADLALVVNGTLTLGYNAKLTAHITANSVNDAGGGGVTITGNLTATGGNIALAYQTSVSGNLSTSGSGSISTGQNGSIGGNVSAGSGTISIAENGTVAGSVTGTGAINIGQKAVVSGNVSAGAGAISLGFQSRINGNVASTGSIALAQEARVGGSITGGSGNVAVGYAATVVGTLTTGSGSIDFAQNATASSCVRSTGSARITLGYQSRVNSICCGASCSNSCVVNNSAFAMPPACAGSTTLLADYRMDEATGWNGTAAEVRDASGNGHHARAATASAGSPVATTASGSPAYGNTSNGSCGYGHFNRSTPAGQASHTYVQLPGSFPALTGSFTVLAWIRSTNPSQSGQRIIANDDNQNGWALSLGDVGSASLRLFNRNMNASGSVTTGGSNGAGASNGNCGGGTFCLDSARVIAANTWYYVAASVDTVAKQVQTQIYNASGTLLASASSAYTGNWAAGSGGTTLGGESASSSEGQSRGFHFYGHIDEVQVYSGVLNGSAITAQLARSRSCPAPAISSFAISGTGSASTCTPQTLTLTARDAQGNTLSSYTGTVSLSTSSGQGSWSAGSGPAPSGTLVAGSNNGQASYTFAAGDAGVVRLRLAHNAAQNVTVTVVDSSVSSTSSTSAAINYRDNAFVWAEDMSNLVPGSNVAVVGRNHPLQVTLIRKDPVTGSCGAATDYGGNRALKLWRTDSSGSWTAPSVASPALSVPATRPGANNLTLSFSSGVASFNLATTHIGRYAFTLEDDSLAYAATAISGSSADLVVRPFTLAVTGLAMAGTANPAGSAATDAVFGKAGAPFSATVTAYRWASGADANNDGVPDAGATLAQVSAGGAALGFDSSVALTPLAGSQTPTGGVLGTLANGTVSGFSAGTASVANLAYSEVGSFQLNTSGVVSNYLGSGLALNALVFNAAGSQNSRVGRFTPAGFGVSGGSVTHRVEQSCAVASGFSYLDEFFRLGFTLTALNSAGATTQNYTGSFARLDLASPANFKLAGIAGATMFKTGNARLALGSSTGSWSAGVASVSLTARALRAAAPDGPFDSAAFGIAPVDLDGVGVLTPDLDTDAPANGADSVKLGGTIPLRYGRLRLQNAMGPQGRSLALPLAAQYWTGTAFTTNTLDSCTRISTGNLSFGNLRNVTAANATLVGSSSAVSAGIGRLTLAAPGSSGRASYDVAIALDAATPPADASCPKTASGWVPAKAATAGANLAALRGAWCGSTAGSDPSARATWGLYRGADGVLYQRENY